MALVESSACRDARIHQWAILILLVFGVVQNACPISDASHEVVIGVLSHHGYDESIRQWSATAEYLTNHISGYHFTLHPFQIEDIDRVMSQPKCDFIISCPSQYIEMEVVYGATRISTMKTEYTAGTYDVFSAVLFWNSKNDQIHDTEDLNDKKLIGIHEKNCTIWYVISHELMRYGFNTNKDLKETSFAYTNQEVVSKVRSGLADIGVIRSDVFDKMVRDGDIQPGEFTVFHEEDSSHANIAFVHSTVAYPERVFAKLKHVGDDLAEVITVSLINMSNEDIAAQSAKCAGWTIPHNYQDLHDCLKTLRVSPYEDYGRATIAGIFSQYKNWIISIVALAVIILAGLVYVFDLYNRLMLAKKVIVEREIVEVSDRTQKLIAETLHNGIGQDLTAIRFLAEAAKEEASKCVESDPESIDLISDLASKTLTKTRELSKELFPVGLSTEDLSSVVEKHLANIRRTFRITTEMEWPSTTQVYEPGVALHLYRIIQEAIHNSIRHGQAKNIFVRLKESDDSLILHVQDDGIGFIHNKTDHNGMGLHLMKYRANALHGKLAIYSNNGNKGVTVECNVPKHSETLERQ